MSKVQLQRGALGERPLPQPEIRRAAGEYRQLCFNVRNGEM